MIEPTDVAADPSGDLRTEEDLREELRRYVDRHPKLPEDFILIARQREGLDVTIWTVADVAEGPEPDAAALTESE
jgi:hypothetical protein